MGSDKRLALVAVFVIGLLVGWFVLGWWLFPVTWTGAYLQDLRPEDKQQVLLLTAENYQLTGDAQAAQQSLRQLGSREEVSEMASAMILQAEADGDQATADAVRTLALDQNLLEGEGAVVEATPSGTEPTTEAEGAEGPGALAVCGAVAGILLLLGGIVLAAWLLAGRRPTSRPTEELIAVEQPSAQEVDAADWETYQRPAQPTPQPAVVPRAALVHEHTAVYEVGNETYDESFDIEAPEAGYLGECGMTISELVNGDPNRVTALEVWLFDKSDIRTVTKVLMSDYAYGNQALRDKLSSRGEALLASPELRFVLDAQTLRLEGQVTALQYVEGETPPHGSFRRVSVALKVTQQVGL